MKKFGLLLLSLLVIYVLYTLWSTGTFRSIKNTEGVEVLSTYNLPGTEDITISKKDSFAILSSTDRASVPPKEQEKGGLYFLDLKDESAQPIHLTAGFKGGFAPHGISMLPLDSSYLIAAVNHVQKEHFIEIFQLKGRSLKHLKTIKDPLLVSPNDLVWMDENSFYVTNDHKYTEGFMQFLENYLGLAVSNVLHYDGTKFKEVAKGIAYANGVNYDRNRKLLFVASPRGFRVKVYEVQDTRDLVYVEDIHCGTGVDNIEFDDEMNLWIGSHPDLIHFDAYAKNIKDLSPSEVIKINYNRNGNTTVESLIVNDGSMMSASTVAVPFGDRLFLGNVKDSKVVVTRLD